MLSRKYTRIRVWRQVGGQGRPSEEVTKQPGLEAEKCCSRHRVSKCLGFRVVREPQPQEGKCWGAGSRRKVREGEGQEGSQRSGQVTPRWGDGTDPFYIL